MVSKVDLYSCDISCDGCFGPKPTDCLKCSSDSRGNNAYISMDKIYIKSGISCPCSKNFKDTGAKNCPCLDPYYIKAINAINFCICIKIFS